MFELKLKLHKILINKKLSRSQEKVSSQVIDSNPFSVFLSAASKLLVLCFFGVVILFPFFLMISISFMTDDEAQGLSNNFRILSDFETGSTYYSGEGLDVRPWADVVQNTYARALTSGYWKSVGITSLNVIVSVILKVLLTFLMGYAFSLRSWKVKGFVWFVALSLLVLPEVALLSGQYTVVIRTGLRSNLFTIVLAISLPFVSSIFNTVMYKNAFEAIPGRIKEVSLVDGAGGFKYLFKVAFPMVVPTTLTIVILTALASWNSYLWPSLILGSRSEYELISTWLFKAGLNPDDPDSNQAVFTNIKMAAAMAVIAPLFIFYLVFRKRIMGAISRQGSTIKG
ncbi:carbohydrate ABC transporter permease [Mycoplasmopsis felis]|uniref:carbohydrate ABC transporter permease n=1 Tax=Mycoplasmopsis felis TaxID=33923 RepID=UPI002AFF82D3|nr:carbohydrate ABC transporter permease [Mycoplasmopsis felis]WQQ08965.1 carbohydrate ABC transporter permease [Mycoplasmopsis felis]